MPESLTDLLKKRMGYTETPDKCGACKFSKEVDPPYRGEELKRICTFNNIEEITVSVDARCNRFEPEGEKIE